VPQKAQSKLDPSSDFSVRLYRVSGKAQQEHNQVQKEGEMVRAAVMDFGSVSSFRSGEQTHSSFGLYIDLHEGLEILRGQGGWHRFEGIIGSSRAIREVLDQVLTVAPAEVHGPHRRRNRHRKGTYRACHPHAGRRRACPFVKLNCAAIPAKLLESELVWARRGCIHRSCYAEIGPI